MNWIKRQIRYYQHEAIDGFVGRFNDMDQGVEVVSDEDYNTVIYYTPGINQESAIKQKIRSFIDHAEFINKHEIHFLTDYDDD